MRIFAPLAHRPIATLWSGQLLSALGDEVNRVATVWLAAQLWGAGAGRLLALHAACACAFSLAGGALLDGVSHRRVLIATDVARALTVSMIPVGVALGAPVSVLLLASVALSASLSSLFEPALQALTFALIPAPALRGATNALMASTARFARVLGPSLVALAGAFVAPIQFFTLDAATFALSAVSIAAIGVAGARGNVTATASSRVGLVDTLRDVARDPIVNYAMWSGSLVTAAWWLLLPLGMELVLRARGAHDMSALATILMAYGVGNLASNLLVANFAEGRPERLMFLGRVIAGCGFLLFAAAPTRAAMLFCAALAASGGPVTDVGFVGMLQTRVAPDALARVYRANLALGYAGMFVLFFVSPWLFRALGVVHAFVMAAVIILAGGAVGLMRFRAEPFAS